MEPNEITIRRVFVRPDGQLKMDDTLQVGAANQIVVEWEAGATANAGIPTVDFDIAVFDITTGDLLVPVISIAAVPLNGLNHETIYELVHPVGAAFFVADNMYEITVSLHQPPNIVSFGRSPMFYVFP